MTRAPLLPALLVFSLPACRDYQCEQSDLDDISPGIPENLNDVDLDGQGFDDGAVLAVGDGGLIATAKANFGPFTVERPVDVDLRAALLGPLRRAYVAGSGGTLLGSSFGSGAWEPIETGTSADLYDLAWVEVYSPEIGVEDRQYQLAVGDEVVLLRDPVDDSWDVVPPPAGGWGRLRAVTADHRLHVAGLDGVIWSTDDPRGTWTRADSGTTVDLLGGGGSWHEAVIVGEHGTLLHHVTDHWVRVPSTIEADLIGLESYTALGSDGHVYDVLLLDEPERSAWVAPGARGVASSWEIVTVGDAGRMTRVRQSCD